MSVTLPFRHPLLTPQWAKNDLWRRARSAPSLDLRFADNKSLVDATTGQNLVTFTRASSGTYVDSQGVIRTATTNLNTNSEAFDTYAVASGSVVANQGVAPNGTLTADKLTSTGGGVFKSIGGLISGATYVISVYAKYISGGTNFLFGFDANPSSGRAVFNLQTGAFVSAEANVSSYSITPVGNGWHRVTVTAVATSTSAVFVFYNGTSGSEWLLWGAQLEQSSTVGEYIPTTSTINSAPRFDHNPTTGESLGLLVEEQRTNLLVRSEEFGTTWSTLNAVVSSNSSTSPNAASTADTLTPDASSAAHLISQSTAVTASIAYTASVFVKGDGAAFAQVAYDNGASVGAFVNVNLSTGAITRGPELAGGATNATGSVVALANGWYRITVGATHSGTTGRILVSPLSSGQSNAGLNPTTTTTTGDKIVLWGAQLEAGSFPTSYIPTTTTAVTRSADVASITGSNFGTFRTNLLLRSEEFSNASWAKDFTTATADAGTAPNGTTTADKVAEDSSNNFHAISQYVSGFASGAIATLSIYAKAAGRTRFRIQTDATGGTGTADFDLLAGTATAGTGVFSSGSISNVGDGWYRCSVRCTTSGAGAIGLKVILAQTNYGTAYTGDGTSGLLLWGAQLETGSTATAVIPTTTAAVTVFESSWYRQDEGTVFWNGVVNGQGTEPGLLGLINAGQTDFLRISRLFNLPRALIYFGNVSQADLFTVNELTLGQAGKFAVSMQTNNVNTCLNGQSIVSDTSVTMPVVDRMTIGTGAFLTQLNGTIRRLTYFPTRLANSTLQQITQ